MTGPTHALVGLAATIVFARATGIMPGSVGTLIVIIGSLAPDIDGDGSITRPGKLFGRFLHRRTALILDQLGQVVRGIAQLISRHRGFFHWPALAVIMMSAGFIWNKIYLFWFGWGYFWHIIADACTVSGVPLLAPFDFSDYRFSKLRTGSFIEGLVFLGLLFFIVVLGRDILPPHTQDALNRMLERAKSF